MEIIIIVSGGLIPIVNSSAIFDPIEAKYSILVFSSSVLGFIVTIAVALSKLEKYFETWNLYRTNAEVLKKEKFLYQNNAGQYAKSTQEDRNRILVENIEFILSSEVTRFFSMQERVRQTVTAERKREENKDGESSPSTTTESSPSTTTESSPSTTTESSPSTPKRLQSKNEKTE